ncbi:J domain-containing protein [Tropicibacter oceani]|uniref:J domain-containing protein n=1 Tax=Tropicibacter oceani TaxID=3058420 RepID=A0ABY8QLX4_9RHOB|nr:J domain-containing protein [Tropicibacter oceani]WGW04938.1 J domain-containing protein [Tropicibacter oceani]
MPRRTEQTCPYTLLGVSPKDEFSTIRAAWRRLVKTYHPDVWYGSPQEATRRLMAVNDAYDRLSVLHRRVQSALNAQDKAETAKRAARPAGNTRPTPSPRPAPQPAEPVSQPSVRNARPSPFAGQFDDARRIFGEQQVGAVQAFA